LAPKDAFIEARLLELHNQTDQAVMGRLRHNRSTEEEAKKLLELHASRADGEVREQSDV